MVDVCTVAARLLLKPLGNAGLCCPAPRAASIMLHVFRDYTSIPVSEFDKKHGTHEHTDAPSAPSVPVTTGGACCATIVVPWLTQSREIESMRDAV